MDSTAWTLGVIGAGIVIVVGGILLLRLHAFLALTFGALAVAMLTPTKSVDRTGIEKEAFTIREIRPPDREPPSFMPPENSQWLGLHVHRRGGSLGFAECEVLRPGPDGLELIGSFKPEQFAYWDYPEGTFGEGVSFQGGLFVPEAGDVKEPNEGDLVIPTGTAASIRSASRKTITARVAAGFGNTAMKIGILIAMASIIGKCLLESGAADRIVRTSLNLFGEKMAAPSFVLSGFLLGIPVFFDTVFYLMIPLGKAMQLRTGRNYLLYVMTIVAGGTMAHSLVPPTPGPLVVAEQLGVDIGTMILAGCMVGIFPALFGLAYATMANRIWKLPLRESAEFSLKDLEEISNRDESELPPFWLSVLPILLPVILIAGYSALKALAKNEVLTVPDSLNPVLATLGDKNTALIISALIAMLTYVRSRNVGRQQLADAVSSSLASGGVIILITSAGGAFGKALQETGVAGLIQDLPIGSPALMITFAWLITAAIRTAQGSATVAMMTAVGILAGLAESGQLGFSPVWLAVAIGCGSKPIAWMNDSGFWVITRMSGMSEGEGLKYITPMTTLMGIVGLVVTIAAATLFPDFGM